MQRCHSIPISRHAPPITELQAKAQQQTAGRQTPTWPGLFVRVWDGRSCIRCVWQQPQASGSTGAQPPQGMLSGVSQRTQQCCKKNASRMEHLPVRKQSSPSTTAHLHTRSNTEGQSSCMRRKGCTHVHIKKAWAVGGCGAAPPPRAPPLQARRAQRVRACNTQHPQIPAHPEPLFLPNNGQRKQRPGKAAEVKPLPPMPVLSGWTPTHTHTHSKLGTCSCS